MRRNVFILPIVLCVGEKKITTKKTTTHDRPLTTRRAMPLPPTAFSHQCTTANRAPATRATSMARRVQLTRQTGLQATSGFHTPKAVTCHEPTAMGLLMIGHSLGCMETCFAIGSPAPLVLLRKPRRYIQCASNPVRQSLPTLYVSSLF